MAKSLGQIHTVSYQWADTEVSLASNNTFLVDLPGQLTQQLQHMVRMMQTFKLVGIDMSYGPLKGAEDIQCSMSGHIGYYAPTKGRVEALKGAYHSVRRMMKLSGVDPKDAITYDFRPMIAAVYGNPTTAIVNTVDFMNQASIEDNGLPSCLANGPGSANIFGIYNQQIQPRGALGASVNFEDGFNIGLRTNADSADWTLNEGVYLQALSAPTAIEALETIPFELGYSSATSESGVVADEDFQWRPDPALYLSILTGQLLIYIDESSAVDSNGDDALDETELDISLHVAGWKSILGGNRKRRSSKKGGKRHGRRRRSKK